MRYDIRELTLGGILDQAITLTKNHFGSFVAIMAITWLPVQAADALFRFDAGLLKKLQPRDFESVERILERWPEVSQQQHDQLLETIIPALTTRLDMEPPGVHDRQGFLEELLAAEYRRQNRELG